MIKIYSDVRTRKTYYETWGASTKHPDMRVSYNEWPLAGKGIFETSHPVDIAQWLAYCIAETLLSPFELQRAMELISSAYTAWYESK